MKGMYIHIPFCLKKCGYCDFYSVQYSRSLAKIYADAIISRLQKISDTVDTVYFGGGTPSVLGDKLIYDILQHINIAENAEITVECNPKTATAAFLSGIASAGVNRISIGLQSADDGELKLLTRTHTAEDVKQAVTRAQNVRIDNISLDIMLGIQNQTPETVKKTVRFCNECKVTHISAYMLKIEPETPFAKLSEGCFPDDDKTALLYETACDELEKCGFEQYEISNFAKNGKYSRHNLKYWNCDEYYGIGPAAHSFLCGVRRFYPRDLDAFINGNEPEFEDEFDGFDEYAMLRLRLNEGLRFDLMAEKSITLPDDFLQKCQKYIKSGFMETDNNSMKMTRKGFLVQNSILCDLLDNI